MGVDAKKQFALKIAEYFPLHTFFQFVTNHMTFHKTMKIGKDIS